MRRRRREPDPEGVVAIHASAVRTEEGALLFLGPSGTGKSTLCELMSERAEVLADDKVYLVSRGSRSSWGVADAGQRVPRGPLTEEEAAALELVRLRAVFRLHQEESTHVDRVDALTGCRYLVNAFWELYWHEDLDEKAKREAYRHLAQISRSTETYDLSFDGSTDISGLMLGSLAERDSDVSAGPDVGQGGTGDG